MVDYLLNLYPLFVNYVFGSLLLAWLGIAFGLAVIGVFTRMSPLLIMTLVSLFSVAFGVGYVGAIVALPLFIISIMYFALAFANWLGGK